MTFQPLKKSLFSKEFKFEKKKKGTKTTTVLKNKPIYQIERVSSFQAKVTENSIQSNYL